MAEVEAAAERLKQLVSDINTKAAQDTIASAELYSALQTLLSLALDEDVPIAQIVATATLSALNDILVSKQVLITYALQTVLIMVYNAIFDRETPGYIVRNIVQSLITACNNKVRTIGARECCLQLLGSVFEKRFYEVSSLLQDIFKLILAHSRSAEVNIRVVANKSMIAMIRGGGYRLVESYPEILKLCGKYVTDKSPKVRLSVCHLIREVSSNGALSPLKFNENFIAALFKGIDDEVPSVQNEFASVLAFVSALLFLPFSL